MQNIKFVLNFKKYEVELYSKKIINSAAAPCKAGSNYILNSNNIRYSFLFGLILDSLNININEEASHHLNYVFGIFILALICLLNFINVVGYLSSMYLISKYDIESKFPKLKIFIKYYESGRSPVYSL